MQALHCRVSSLIWVSNDYYELGIIMSFIHVSIVATCIAVHFAVCHALYNNKSKKIGQNRCFVFLNDLVLFCSVILSL